MRRIKIALQQDHRGQLIDSPLPLTVRHSCATNGSLGFAAGPALIAKLDRQTGFALQFGGKLARVVSLAAGVAAHVQRVPQQESRDAALHGKAPERFDIFSPAPPLDGFQTLRGKTELIADSPPDPFPSEVEGQYPLFVTGGNAHDSIVFGRLACCVFGSLLNAARKRRPHTSASAVAHITPSSPRNAEPRVATTP